MFGANRTGDAATTLHKLTIIFKAEGEFYSPSCLLLYPIVVGVVKGGFSNCPVDHAYYSTFFRGCQGRAG
jgi:hypothetical protein